MNNYDLLIKQIERILDPSLPTYSNLSNVSAILNQMEKINWVGFYIVNEEELILGPLQGEVACTRIQKGKGVCGTAFLKKEKIIVDDVNQFEGHIACSNKSKSEIVVPIIINDDVVAVIDVDSPIYSRFSYKEKDFLEEVSKILVKVF